MCLGAIYWARPSEVYFGATHTDAAAAGFDDSFIYQEIALAPEARAVPMVHLADPGVTRPFEEWASRAGKVPY